MESLQKLNPNSLKGLTSEKILGIQELKTSTYSDVDIKAIKTELMRYAGSKNENISENTVNCWLMDFQELQTPAFEVIKRIRLSKSIKNPKAITDFSVFMNVDLSEYSSLYEHEKKEIKELVFCGYGKAIPNFNHWIGLTPGKEYDILDELPPDKECQFGYVLIRDDRNYSIFYGKDNFTIKQG